MAGSSSDTLLTTPVDRALLTMSAPISLGMVSTFLFHLVDTAFVGVLGPDALAALAFAATVYILLVGLFMGLAVGVSSVVAGALGRGDTAAARRSATVALLVAVLAASAVSAAAWALHDPLFAALGAGPALSAMILEYLQIIYLAMPLLVVGLIGGAVLRATGQVKPPEVTMMLAGVINLVLDPIFIFGFGPVPAMGLAGAALATGLSLVFVCITMLALMLRRGLLAPLGQGGGREAAELWRLSAPAIATQVLVPLTAIFVTWLVAFSGPDAVAALGVATRIEMLALVGITSVTVALVPLVAQNHAAHARERVLAAVAFAGRAAVYWGVLLVVVLIPLAGPLARIFSDDAAIVGTTSLYFLIVAVSYAPQGLVMTTAAILNGAQAPREALRVLMVKTFALTLPLTALGALVGVWGIFVGIAVSNVLGAVYAGRRARIVLGDDAVPSNRRVMADYRADWRALTRRLRRA